MIGSRRDPSVANTPRGVLAMALAPGAAGDDGAVHVERALRLVRCAAAVIAMAAVVGVRSSSHSGLHALGLAGEIALGTLAINLFTLATERKGWIAICGLGGQVLDVAGSLALVAMLDHALGGAGWTVLLLPIVMGGVRFGASGTLLAWTLCSSGYLGLALTDMVHLPGGSSQALSTSVQRFAFLLALSVPVAALTQWMQQRWEQQRLLTVAAGNRAHRLELVEAYARDLAGSTEKELVATLARGALGLGFDTVTITRHEPQHWSSVAMVGEPAELPDPETPPVPRQDETLVTQWDGDDGEAALFSVSVTLEPEPGLQVLHGWCHQEVDDDLAAALGLLGAHARVALQSARLLAELQQQATRDPLTHLLNRRAYNDLLEHLSERQQQVSLLILDLDHFKAINDGFGHPAGDKVLRVVSERLRAVANPAELEGTPSVARLGGDEFAIVLAGSPVDEVVEMAEAIEQAMREPIAIGPTLTAVSFSIGIADARGEWQTEDLIDAADEATYQAKSNGRARTCWASHPVGREISPESATEILTESDHDLLIESTLSADGGPALMEGNRET